MAVEHSHPEAPNLSAFTTSPLFLTPPAPNILTKGLVDLIFFYPIQIRSLRRSNSVQIH